jgi:LCP family protein required for cell wall assembly
VTYRVYKAGQDEPVRVAPATPREPRPLARRAQRAAGERGAPEWRRPVGWALVALGVAGVAVLVWRYGPELWSNSLAGVDLARLSGKVPDWALYGAPALAAAIVAVTAVYLAFGRHAALKSAALAAVVVALGAPGFAVGWANGTVGTVGHRTEKVQAAVEETKEQLKSELPGKATNILLIGRDMASPGDPGRSDSQILVRLDPATRSISMLSLPRDLHVEIPGVGYEKMNAAHTYGGPALVVETFSAVTGLDVNHFIEIDFAGFWHAVNILGGVYIPVDHRYYNGETVHIEPGYQLVRGGDALDFVRFRHDQQGDFTRMQRQQLFLTELQRQSDRWSSDWSRVLRIIRAVTAETTSDIDSLRKLAPLVRLIFAVDTSNVHSVHVEGMTPTIDGVSYVEASPAEIAQAVAAFSSPVKRKTRSSGPRITKGMYDVTVHNTTYISGLATSVAEQLAAAGYRTEVGVDAPESASAATDIYAPKDLTDAAQTLGDILWPSEVHIVERAPGTADGIQVFVGSQFDGGIELPGEETVEPAQTILVDQAQDLASWQQLDDETPITLQMPTVWSPGLRYDEFRAYKVETTGGRMAHAAVAVGATPKGGYFNIQAMRWLHPPAIDNPDAKRVVDGTKYLFFYQGGHVHMIAWRRGNTLYWVLNTLDNELDNELITAMATSFARVK